MPFLRGEPACGGEDQGSSPAHGTVQPSSPAAQPAWRRGCVQQPRPVLAQLGLLALRIPIATHLAIRKKMHRLHLASRWDCPPVYFQGTWRCEAPSWAASCLLYPQQQRQQQTRTRGRGFRREPSHGRYPPVHYHTITSFASRFTSLFFVCFLCSSTCYIPSRPSSPISLFLTFRHHDSSYGASEHPSSLSLSVRPSKAALRTFPSTALESSNARATCQSLPQSYQIITPPLQTTSGGQEAPPTTPVCPPASSNGLGLPLLQFACSKRSRLQPSRDHFSFLRIPTSTRSRPSIVFLRLSGRTPCSHSKQHHNLLLIFTAKHGSCQS